MKIENILPIGTVVELKDIQAKIMIAGYGSVSEQNPNYTWDYSVHYPLLWTSGQDDRTHRRFLFLRCLFCRYGYRLSRSGSQGAFCRWRFF